LSFWRKSGMNYVFDSFHKIKLLGSVSWNFYLNFIKKKTLLLEASISKLTTICMGLLFLWLAGGSNEGLWNWVCETEDTSNCCTMKLILKVVVLW
jgi:hypothetical protein